MSTGDQRLCWQGMPSSRRHPVLRFTRRVRHALCALVAAAMALAPLVSTAAQTHEAAHAAQGEVHFHDVGHHGHDAQGASDHQGDMADEGGALHVLAHAAHACGHVLAILGASFFAAPVVADTIILPVSGTPSADGPRTHPFRPPIA
jgi:hypothetical protein